jgi:site-specific recombinase XerD/ribosomal protein L40E
MLNDNYYREREKYDLDTSMKKNPDLSDSDREIIKDYLSFKKKTDKISKARGQKIGFNLITFRRFLPMPFKDATLKNITDSIEAFEEGMTKPQKGREQRPFSANYKNDLVTNLKGFLIWASGKNEGRIKHINLETEDVRDYVTAPKGKDFTEVLNPQEVLTEGDVMTMLKAAPSERNRTAMFLTYESGCRIGEVTTLKWSDIVFERKGEEGKEVDTAKLYVTDHKKKKKRYVRLTMCVPDLINHKNISHAAESDHIFMDDGQPMTYAQMNRMFKYMAGKSGITKPVTPHCFRHARATELIRQGYSAEIIKAMLWNNLDTKMFKIYVALVEGDIDAEVFKKKGIKVMLEEREEKREKNHEPIPCPECHTSNPFDSGYCRKCGHALSDKAKSAVQAEAALAMKDLSDEDAEALINNPKVKALILNLVTGVKSKV